MATPTASNGIEPAPAGGAPEGDALDAIAGTELKGIGYELFVLFVGVLSVVNTAIVLLPFTGNVQQVALLVDGLIVPVFLLDFVYRLRTAPSRRRYFLRQFGWADMLSIVPTFGLLRVFRIVRVIRLLRAYGARGMAGELDRTRALATFLLTLFLVIGVVEFAGMAIYVVESREAAGNIKNASDAVWWGFVTITTVGYGDRYPVTDVGRFIGTLLLFAGIALFSVLTGFIANAFLAPRAPGKHLIRAPKDSLEQDVDELRWMLVEQEERAAAIRRKLDEIERKARGRRRRGESG
ncbi:MAG TPA: ion transporter [Candidatus Limnocylindrales bacterium]|nr:ion transporter [Candidatus Limnocylindrales bacterium]